ncbi:MAG: hypothetical protein FWF41_08815 [Betaproteobacteria bacterium]|nr:hypothetical protein [Betaproteobacteria bacterium]
MGGITPSGFVPPTAGLDEMKNLLPFFIVFLLASCVPAANQQRAAAVEESSRTQSMTTDERALLEEAFKEHLAKYIDCANDERFDPQVADALKAYTDKDAKKFLSLIKNIECLNSSPFFSVKGGAAIVRDNFYLVLSSDNNTTYDGETRKEWQGQPSRKAEVVAVDLVKRTVSNDVPADYKQQKLVLLFFCRERVYVLDYGDKVFGYYTNHVRQEIPQKWPDEE